MEKYYHFIEINSTIKNVFIGLFLIVLFNTFLLPVLPTILWDSQVTIDKILDLKFSYNFDQCYELFNNLEITGRKAYLKSTLFIDDFYAIIYSLTYAIIIFRLLKVNKLLKYKFLIFTPFIIGLFDLFENLGIITLLYNYPLKMKNIVLFSSFSTSIKWVFAGIVFIIILSNILIFMKNKIKTIN